MTDNMFRSLTETAVKTDVEVGELCLDPKMQMRVEMDHDAIEDYADDIKTWIKNVPIEVVIVESGIGETLYVVDGFHRTFAAMKAELATLPVIAYRGTYEQAVQYAMTRNQKHGVKPTPEDRVKAAGRILETAPDFGYKASSVVPWLVTFGFKKRSAERASESLRASINNRRDVKIMELHEDGLSLREIAKEVGGSPQTIKNVVEAVQKASLAENGHREHLKEGPQDNSPFFDEEETEELDIVNPADAFNKALQEQASEAEDTTVTSNIPSSGNKDLIAHLESALSIILNDADAVSTEVHILIEKLTAHA